MTTISITGDSNDTDLVLNSTSGSINSTGNNVSSAPSSITQNNISETHLTQLNNLLSSSPNLLTVTPLEIFNSNDESNSINIKTTIVKETWNGNLILNNPKLEESLSISKDGHVEILRQSPFNMEPNYYPYANGSIIKQKNENITNGDMLLMKYNSIDESNIINEIINENTPITSIEKIYNVLVFNTQYNYFDRYEILMGVVCSSWDMSGIMDPNDIFLTNKKTYTTRQTIFSRDLIPDENNNLIYRQYPYKYFKYTSMVNKPIINNLGTVVSNPSGTYNYPLGNVAYPFAKKEDTLPKQLITNFFTRTYSVWNSQDPAYQSIDIISNGSYVLANASNCPGHTATLLIFYNLLDTTIPEYSLLSNLFPHPFPVNFVHDPKYLALEEKFAIVYQLERDYGCNVFETGVVPMNYMMTPGGPNIAQPSQQVINDVSNLGIGIDLSYAQTLLNDLLKCSLEIDDAIGIRQAMDGARFPLSTWMANLAYTHMSFVCHASSLNLSNITLPQNIPGDASGAELTRKVNFDLSNLAQIYTRYDASGNPSATGTPSRWEQFGAAFSAEGYPGIMYAACAMLNMPPPQSSTGDFGFQGFTFDPY